MKLKLLAAIIFLIGLWLVILPTPSSIDSFSGLPGSIKSIEPGDTIQNPNIAAYYTDFRRQDVTSYYRDQFQKLHCQSFSILNPFCIFPPIRLNLPVEYSFIFIHDQEQSTYLEEYLYPFKDSIYVNGYEPYDVNGVPFSKVSYPIFISGKFYDSKATLRWYGGNVMVRTLIYTLTWVGIIWMYWLAKRSFKKHG